MNKKSAIEAFKREWEEKVKNNFDFLSDAQKKQIGLDRLRSISPADINLEFAPDEVLESFVQGIVLVREHCVVCLNTGVFRICLEPLGQDCD
jgi:hypothetical protein